MKAHNFFAVGQADTRTFVLTSGVEALKNDEYFFKKLFLYADPIVSDRKLPVPLLLFGLHNYLGGRVLFAELQGVAD